jgi:hypothetical protein
MFTDNYPVVTSHCQEIMANSGIAVAEKRHETTQVPCNDSYLAELEALAGDRYTERDEEYMKVGNVSYLFQEEGVSP